MFLLFIITADQDKLLFALWSITQKQYAANRITEYTRLGIDFILLHIIPWRSRFLYQCLLFIKKYSLVRMSHSVYIRLLKDFWEVERFGYY